MNKIKLKYKMVIIYFVTGFVPMLLLFIFAYVQMKEILTEKDNKNVQTYMNQSIDSMNNQLGIYNNLSNYISYNDTISQVVSYSSAATKDDKGDYELYEQLVLIMDPMLSSLRYFHNDIKQVTIYIDNDFKHDTTIAPLDEIRTKYWFDNSKEQAGIVWYGDIENNKLFTTRKMPILARNNILGILYIEVDYDKMFQAFEQNTSSNYGVFVTDEEDNVLYSYSKFSDKYKDYQLNFDKLLEETSNAKSEYTIISENANDGMWKVYLYTPKKIAVHSAEPIMYMIALAVILSLSAASIAIIAFSRFVTKRIVALMDNMQEVEKGNLTFNITDIGDDEIGNLILGFRDMIDKLNTLINEVYESRISQKEFEMRALQAQINPHFLYNSLSLINWKAIEADKKDISDITLALSTFYRTSLNKGKNVLRLEDEINNMKSYVMIQLLMHDNSFDVDIDVDEDILKYESLNLILQPLIENAIEHGIDLKTEGKGLIEVTGRKQEGLIVLSVKDNGVGMSQETIDGLFDNNSKGYGVKNVDARLKLFYGEMYGLRVESIEEKGTTIYISFPARLPE